MSRDDNFFVYDNLKTNMDFKINDDNVDNVVKKRENYSKNIQIAFFVRRITELLKVADGNGLSSNEILQTVIDKYEGVNFRHQILYNVSESTIIQRRNMSNRVKVSEV